MQNTLATHGYVDAGWHNWSTTSYNHISDVFNGIYVNNFWRQNAFSNSNDVRVQPYPSNVKWLQFGINHTLCRKNEMYTNDIKGSVGTGAMANDSMRAFYAVSNTAINIGCNAEDSIGRGFEFYLTNPATAWHDNNMSNNKKGVVLNGAVIGTQYYGGQPMNNVWSGIVDTETYVYNGSNAINSKFYVTGGIGTNPTVNGGPIFPFRYLAGTSVFTVSGTFVSPCPIPNDDNVFYALRAYEDIAKEHVIYTDNIVPHNWMGQYELWKNIKADSSLTDSSVIIAAFDSMARHSRYAYITEMENLLAEGYFDSVTVMLGYDIDSMTNTSFDSTTMVKMSDSTYANNIVMNYQEFFRLYIKYMKLSLDGTDSIAVTTLAALCPQRNGTVVFQARALHSEIFNGINLFNDDSCMAADPDYIAERRTPDDKGKTKISKEQKYVLYLNPNDGNFVIQQNIPDEKPVTTVIYDAIGRKIYNRKLHFDSPKSTLNMGNYPSGLYLLEITDSKNQIFRFKFVITK